MSEFTDLLLSSTDPVIALMLIGLAAIDLAIYRALTRRLDRQRKEFDNRLDRLERQYFTSDNRTDD